MSEVLEKNTEIESDEAMVQEFVSDIGEMAEAAREADEKVWDLRPLFASDMGAICKIISAIGIRQFKECFNIEELKKNNTDKDDADADTKKNINVEKVGIGIMFDIAGIIISNIPKAEEEIQAFLASVTGMKVSEVRKMKFADYGELIMTVVMKEDFQDFFKRVMKLFNR